MRDSGDADGRPDIMEKPYVYRRNGNDLTDIIIDDIIYRDAAWWRDDVCEVTVSEAALACLAVILCHVDLILIFNDVVMAWRQMKSNDSNINDVSQYWYGWREEPIFDMKWWWLVT